MGSMRTTFVLFNPTDQIVVVTLTLTNDAGNAMEVTIPGQGTSDQFGPLTLQPGQSMLLQTDGAGPLTTGAARVQSTGAVGVSAIYSLYDNSQRFVTEAGVASSPLLTQFVVPVDSTGPFDTGIALFNPGDDATLTYTLIDANGAQVATPGNPRADTLAAGRHVSNFFSGTGGLFPAIGDIRGTMVITSNVAIAGIVLRQNDDLSNTTLPVVSRAETRTSFNLAQVANGVDALTGLRMRTTFIAFNISATAATVNFTVRRPDSTPFPVTIPGVANNTSTFSANIPPGGSVFLQTDGSGELSAGSAEVTSNVPVGVAAIFTLFGPTQNFLTEAGVGDSPVGMAHTLPVEVTNLVDTGVAFFNPGDVPAMVTLSLLDSAGVKIDETSTPLILLGKSQQARLVPELFPGRTNLTGSLAVTSSPGGVATVVLRLTGSPLTYATLPIAEGVSQGTRQALLDESRTNINATGDNTFDVQLAAGFRLSGTVTGAAQLITSVVARSNTGQEFAGAFHTLNGRYLVVVPAGAYNLRVCYAPQTGSFENIPSISFGDPNPVEVGADTTRNIVIPAQALHAVSGTVAGIAQLPANDSVLLNLATADGASGGNATVGATGAYQLQLPNGTYTASLVVSQAQAPEPYPPQTSLTLYNIGSVVVNDAPATADFNLPARATVSGIARWAGELIGRPAFIVAADTSAPAMTASGCSFPATSSSTHTFTGGATGWTTVYQMMLETGRSYRLTLSFPEGGGDVSFPTDGRLIGPVIEDVSQAPLDVPFLPGTVTITGKVTDPQGQGVADVNVTASSSHIIGAADVSYRRSTMTDGFGNYRLTVLNGTAYQLFFSPLKPQP